MLIAYFTLVRSFCASHKSVLTSKHGYKSRGFALILVDRHTIYLHIIKRAISIHVVQGGVPMR